MGGPPAGKQLSMPMTVVAIVNGMIGVAILVMPEVALKSGWLPVIVIVVVASFFSFYSSYIGLIHLGDQKDLDTALLRHFNGNRFIKKFYDFVVCCSVFFVVSLFFDMIVTQCESLIFAKGNVANPITNSFILLVWCVLLKYYDFGAHIMGYGILSIIGYLIFLLWSGASAPEGDNKMPVVGEDVIEFLTLMQYGLAVQTYILPVTLQHRNRINHAKIIVLSFIVGAAVYFYTSFIGAHGIANREKANPKGDTIEAFFSGEWEVKVLKAIYVLHLYSVFPEYLFVCKRRFLGLIGTSTTLLKEIIFVSGVVVICTLINISGIEITVIIDLNGAVLSFCFIYLIPTLLHIKCMYFAKGKRKVPEEEMSQHQHQELVEEKQPDLGAYNKEIIENQPYEIEMKEQKAHHDNLTPKQGPQKLEEGGEGREGRSLNSQSEEEQVDYSYFCCNYELPDRGRQIMELGILGVMGVMGMVVLVYGVIDAVKTAEAN